MNDLRTAGARAADVLSTSSVERPRVSVLMVDDQPARLLTYEAMLSGLGVECVRALSGLEALEKLLKQEFAVILLDIHMPGMDGFEVARTVREHPRLERTPIIFVTGVHSSEIDRLKGYELGAIDYISVPVVAEILRSKVAVLVELYSRRNELQALNDELQAMRERIEAQAEQALRDSQDRLFIAKTAAQIGIFDWDIVANFINWDERVYELWGIDPQTPVTYELYAACLHPDDLPHAQEMVESALDPSSSGKLFGTYRIINREDGGIRWIEANGHASFENGRPTRLIGTVQDVTERKNAEQKLRDNDRRKDEFLAMLAHELRNPIAPIRNAAEVLTRLVGDTQSRALVSMIQRQGAHLSRILDDLLDAARITQGRIELRFDVLSIAGCVEHALEALQPQIRAKHLDLAFTRSADPLYARADRVRLEQCIGNVLSNAVKFSDAHGAVRVRLFAEGGDAVVEVRDFGIGIAPELVPSMFELFAQGERGLDRAEGGLGIGLSVCKQLIEMQGGGITGFSAGPGSGATFALRIPLQRPPEQTKLPNVPDIEPARRVLIVDDNRDAADSLAMCLALEGHQTKAVYSARGALEQVDAFHPDIVLLDIGLPSMDGYQVASRIRSTNRAIRVIALTGYGQDEDKQRACAAGFDAHLVKPVDIAALRRALGGSAQLTS